MTFKVKTADLRGYVGLLNRNAEHNDKILAYLRQWCGQEMQAISSEGLLAKALNFHDRIYDDAVNLVTQLGQALRASAAELDKAAKLYDGSDKAAKERFESSQYVVNGHSQREGWEASHSGFADYMNPLDVLTGTPSYTEFSDPTKVLDKIAEVSMTGMVMNFIEELTGTNPLQKIAEFVAGDWKAYSRTAGAWRAIGEALERIGKNIDRGLASLDRAWEGGASEVAYKSFQALADLFKNMLSRFTEVHKAYEQFAQFAMHTASVLVDTLKLAIDTAIIFLTKKKGVFGDAMAGFYTFKIVKYVGYIGWTMLTARGTIATIFGALAGGGSSPLRGVKAMGYDASGI
ncbi:hypothetical protein AAH979_29735 [Plantactinospora sp. ZYX-F-223]|uniref:hypothetical protein n=1 Tax=Plantactinospora sp. ZYX-F-223 TaxID=3144103 RepID=UPI0031FCE7C1